MARRGSKLPDLVIDDVIERLRVETDGKAVKRLVVAREYLDGASAGEIADKYGFPEATVYAWLDRFDERAVDDALYDDPPPGRPPEIGAVGRERLAEALERPPSESGFDAHRWSARLVQRYVRETFGHEYTRRHARRLLAEADSVRAVGDDSVRRLV